MTKIHVDSLLGNDANPGTEAQPKLTFKAAEAAATVFDEISLKAGRCYAPVNGFFPRLKKNGIKLTAYGLTMGADKWTDYPTLDGLTYENSDATGWTHEGDGVWSKTFANTKAKRIWFGSHNGGVLTTDRTIGTAYRRTPASTADTLVAIKAALNSTDRWHPAGSALGWKLYVYTGSTTVAPPVFYAGLAILICDGATIGAEEGIYITQCSGARASNIHVRGAHGDSGRIASMTTDTIATDDAIIQDCISSCNGVSNVWSIRVSSESNANPRKKISNSFIVDIEADSNTSQFEQDPTVSYGNISAMDMFVITGNTENCHIWDFKATNSAHVGAAMGGQDGNEPVNCSILRGYIKYDSWITYGRGIASSQMTNSVIGACVIDGQNVRSQFADGHVVGNKWINNRASIRKPGTDEWAAVECYVYDYGNPASGAYQYDVRKPRDLLIANNYVERPVASAGSYPLVLTTYSSTYPVAEPNPAIELNTVRVYNNIVVLDTSRSWIGSFANGGAIYDQLIKNNIIYTGAGNADATVRWAGATVGMNVRAGQVGNLNVDPLLSASHVPLAASPAIDAGIPYTPIYKGLNNISFDSTAPTIGAYEVVAGGGSGSSVYIPVPELPTSPVPIGQVVNQRDVILQSAATRRTYINNRAVFLVSDGTLFQAGAGGVTTTPDTITLTAFMLGIPGNVTFSTEPSVPLTVVENTATVNGADMEADTLVVTATATYEGLEYRASQTIRKITAVSPIVVLTPTSQVFHIDKAGTITPSSITLTAVAQNLTGTPTFSATGATLTAGANAFEKILTPANMTSDNATIDVDMGGYTDRVTIIKVREGTDAITAFLTNESHTLPADVNGNITSFTGASTAMKVYQGVVDSTALWAFSTSPASGASLTYTHSNGTVTVTGMSSSSSAEYVDITASRAGYASITKRFSLSKSKAGSTGGTGSTGPTGNSYVTAYCASSTPTATSAPSSTSGINSVPAANSGGIVGSWSKTVPTLTAGQFMYQSDGIYDVSTGWVTWSIPYWSSLKVGQLSAITADLGTVTAGTIIGTVIRSSTSYPRVEINDASSNSFQAYNSSGVLVAEIGGTGGGGGYVYGTSSASITAAITGKQTGTYAATEGYNTNASFGTGVYGSASGTSGVGVQGTANGSNAEGVSGTSSAGTGVRGSSSGAGVGGKFSSTTGNALQITGGANGIVQTGGGSNYLFQMNPSTDNAYSLGNSGSFRWTALYAMSATITTSDIRTKNVLGESTLGLDFINDLSTIRYTMKVAQNEVTDNFVEVSPAREETDEDGNTVVIPAVMENQPIVTQRAGTRVHHGLPAQQLREVLLSHGQPDAAMWCLADKDDPDSQQAVRYEELIAPLIKAVQELSAKVDSLQTELAALKQP